MWAVMQSACQFCGQVFGYNPKRVPSLGGEPICEACIKLGNEARVEAGKEPFKIHPKAYEPIHETELW